MQKEKKRMTKAVVDKDFCGQGDANLFKPAKQRYDMLKGVSIKVKEPSQEFQGKLDGITDTGSITDTVTL